MKPKNPAYSHEYLLSIICYDATTGVFTWKGPSRRRCQEGKRAGHFHKGIGYETIMISGHATLSHRLAWFYVHGRWPAPYVDHINGDGGDNRLCNLREANQSQNMANQHKLRKNNISGYRGVSFRAESGKWRALIRINRKSISLGVFETREEAKAAYDTAARFLQGDYANTSI